MKNTKATKVIALFVSVLMILMSFPLTSLASSGFVEPDDMYLVSDTETKIAPGIKENRIVTNNLDGNSQVNGFAVTVSPSAQAGFLAGYADYDGSKWKMQTVRAQAAAAQKARGKNIVVAVNADFFNMSTGEPIGTLVMNGNVYRKGLGSSYFGVTKTGEVVIGKSLTEAVLATLQEAISGGGFIVADGKRTSGGSSRDGLCPRTVVGRKADGSIVIYTADGRDYPVSCGLSMYDLATIMLSLGCVDAINLDGGGSTTYLAKYEGESVLGLKNKPSDAVERKVSSCLFVYSDAKPSGVFDHASLLPNNEVYTPSSEVQFTATGVDSSGSSAELPGDGQFALVDESFGSITEDGLFTPSGKCGTVEVNYVSGGAVCGTTTILVENPDEMFFADEEVSLGFEAESTFGLQVKYKDRDVNYNASDIGFVLSDPSMGTFEGLEFTSSDSATVTGTVKAYYTADESLNCTCTAIIGKLPTVMADFEADDITFGRVAFNANGGIQKWEGPSGNYSFLTGHYLNGDNSSRGGYESAEIVDVDSGEPVRFGNQSLKLNYDFRGINGIEGACVGFTAKSEEVPGNPTGIGMWVYAPEGCPNFWLRIRLLDGQDNIKTLDFTAQKEGINWSGWKYVECDLTTSQGPFKLLGGETIRLMHPCGAYDGMGDYLAGTVTTAGPDANSVALDRSTCVGSVYIDNLQFVYGANTDDIDNPVVDKITCDNETIEEGAVITKSEINLEGYVSDVQNKYTSGIDYSVVRIYVDGVNKSYDSNCVLTEGDGRIGLYGLKLPNGDHSVKILVRDKFGNETTETKNFTVDVEDNPLTLVTVQPEDKIILGQDAKLDIISNNAADIASLDATVNVGTSFPVKNVIFAEGFTGGYTYNAKTGDVKITASRESTPADNKIATVVADIPASTVNGSRFTYSVPSGEFSTVVPVENAATSFAVSTQRIEIEAKYTVYADIPVLNLPCKVYVNDIDGKAVAGINVYYSNGALLGTTGDDGSFETASLTDSVKKTSFYAKDDSGISFVYNTQAFKSASNSDGTPSSITINASADSETEKNISWLSSPEKAGDKAVLQYALKSDYDKDGDAAFQNVEGKTELRKLAGSEVIENNYAIQVNSVIVKNLALNTEYAYRVGNGEIFSAVSTFKTTKDGASTNFFVIGDTQAEDMTNITDIINSIAGSDKDFSFGVQTGDFVEKPTMYADWNNILTVFGKDYMKSVDMIHVIGNHEQFGDNYDDLFVKSLFNISNKAYYSAEYGKVYVAVINYTTNKDLINEALDWLREDSAKSGCQWKILITHQPAYGTNNAATDVSEFHEMIPPVLDELGFDFMFSGHDHAYARTAPMTAGKVADDGVVYYICGSTGEKSYTATDNKEYNFEVVDQEYNAIYLTVEATDEEIKVVAHESNGTEMDSYTKKATTPCVTDGHKFVYSDGWLDCSVCNHAELVGDYTGFAADKATGRTMRFTNGEIHKGWLVNGDDCYYFDEDGLAITGTHDMPTTYTVNGVDYTETITYKFAEDGKQIGYTFFKCEDGYTRAFRGGVFAVGWREIDGKLYFFTSNETYRGMMFTGTKTINIYTGQDVTYRFAADGHLLKGTFFDLEDGRVYYWGPTPLTGWQEIDGDKYYFDPQTSFMVTGDAEIEGKIYAFDMDGVYKHEGAHEYTGAIIVQNGNCVTDEITSSFCKKCGSTKREVTKVAPGHIDENTDGICDVCERSTDDDTPSKDNAFGIIAKLRMILKTIFARIKEFFANIF